MTSQSSDPKSQYLARSREEEINQVGEIVLNHMQGVKQRPAETVARIGVEDLTRRGVQFITPHEKAEMDLCEQAGITKRLIAANGVEPLFADAQFGNVDALDPDDRAEQLNVIGKLKVLLVMSKRPRLVIVVGGVGCGKSHILSGLTNRKCQMGRRARYADARDLIDRARNDGAESVIRDLARVELLVLDEVPAALVTPFSIETIERLVDSRYRRRLDTVLAGNATPEKFCEALGPAVADRAREAGGFIVMNGRSVRGRLIDPVERHDAE